MTKTVQTRTASATRQYLVLEQDLPLSCPMPNMILWNAHPRVFLPLESGQATCPYCGTLYILKPRE